MQVYDAAHYKKKLLLTNRIKCADVNFVTLHSLYNRPCFPAKLTPVVFSGKLLQRNFTNH